MESTPRLYDTLVQVFSQHPNWIDRRHLKTLAWMMRGLMQARGVSLTVWFAKISDSPAFSGKSLSC
jgi:hypothetical protein